MTFRSPLARLRRLALALPAALSGIAVVARWDRLVEIGLAWGLVMAGLTGLGLLGAVLAWPGPGATDGERGRA